MAGVNASRPYNRGLSLAVDSLPVMAQSHIVGLVDQRRRRDSNPRTSCPVTGFQDRRNQPLCHASGWIAHARSATIWGISACPRAVTLPLFTVA